MAKLSKSEMNKLLAQVTEDVAELLKSEAEEVSALTKADPGTQAPGETTPEGSSSAPQTPDEESSSSSSSGGGEGSFSGSADPAAAAMDGGTPAAGPGAEGTVAPDGAPAAGGDPAADAAASPEMLEGEYAKLPPEELEMHIMAAMSAKMKMSAMAQQPAPDAGSMPPAGPDAGSASAAPLPPPGPEASASAPPPMGKGEFDDKSGTKSAGSLGKSEDFKSLEARLVKAEAATQEVEALRKSLAEKDAELVRQNDNINRIAAGVQKIITKQTSMRKSIAGISDIAFVAKPGTTPAAADVSGLSKSEITARLNAATARKDLTKADRDAINKFVVGSESIETVAKFLSISN